MIRIRVEYPWPPKALSPNAGRMNVKAKARYARDHKADVIILTRQAMDRLRTIPGFPRVRMVAEFYPPNRSGPSPDADNIAASCKWLQDGITGELGINDREYGIEYPPRCAEKKGIGAVIVEFQEVRG